MPNFGYRTLHSRAQTQGLTSDSTTLTDSDGKGSAYQEDKELLSLGGCIEKSLKQAQGGVQDLMIRLKSLRKDNKKLKSELESAKAAEAITHTSLGSRHSVSDDDMNLESMKRIRDLERTIKELRAENHRQSRHLEKLKAKQIEAELEDLKGGPRDDKGEGGGQEVDPEYRMRKLLRKFTDLMMVTTIPADFSQTCPICTDNFQLKKCSALQCQHLICNECLPLISKGADETVKCPECRRFTSRDDIELVHMTEQERWDELLGVAQAWDAFDVRGEEETSEEENEEYFINDATETSVEMRNSACDSASDMEETSTGNAVPSKQSTPPPSGGRLYSQSPMKEKRKRMEDLAGRALKKRK
ncbi:hypothetical protein M413DRAFT_441492 [Hebeloma cylindrosporum]|uniref:RING-type domain-containing protein n=1 Tax=Hebeloma cylindrosporum TaxID=76867 RepID=A0A0C3CR69_HEBCY|nr:hypothetical protein M413DRAFT_441492 [Hebeloma cylindrosporum h7]